MTSNGSSSNGSTSNGSTTGTVDDMTDPGMRELTIADPVRSKRSVKVRNMVDRLREVRVPLRSARANGNGHLAVDVGDEPVVADEVLIGEPYTAPVARPRTPATAHHLAAFDLRSVASMATRFYACALAMVLAATVLFWLLG